MIDMCFDGCVVSNSCQICGQTMTKVVPTALRQSGQSVFLSHPDRLSSQVMPWKRCELEHHPARASGSPSTFTCSLICERAWPASAGVPSTGFSPAAYQPQRALRWSAAAFQTWLPVILLVEGVMHIGRGVPVRIHLKVTKRTGEEFPPFHAETLPFLVREPLSQIATARAILGRAMGIHLDSHCASFKSVLFRVFVDLPTQLVRVKYPETWFFRRNRAQ